MTGKDSAFIDNVIAAIKANRHARMFYFPPNKSKRRKMNLRLGREIGYGLRGDKELGSLYSRLIVSFSFDSTGVCVDNKEFLSSVRAGMRRAMEYEK